MMLSWKTLRVQFESAGNRTYYDEDSLSLEPEAGSATMQMEESDSHQDLDDVLSLDKDQKH